MSYSLSHSLTCISSIGTKCQLTCTYVHTYLHNIPRLTGGTWYNQQRQVGHHVDADHLQIQQVNTLCNGPCAQWREVTHTMTPLKHTYSIPRGLWPLARFSSPLGISADGPVLWSTVSSYSNDKQMIPGCLLWSRMGQKKIASIEEVSQRGRK